MSSEQIEAEQSNRGYIMQGKLITTNSTEQTSFRTTLTSHDPNQQQPKTKAKNAKKTFRRLFKYSWKHKQLLLIGSISMIVSTLGMTCLPLLSGNIIDKMNNKQTSENLRGVFILFSGLGIFMAIFSAVRGYSFNLLGQRIVFDMRRQLFKSLISKDISYYDKNKTGALISRLTSDIGVVESAATDDLTILVRNLLQFIGSLVLLFYISWKLTTFILVSVPFIAIIVILIIKILKKYRKEYQTNLAQSNSLANQVFGNIRVVRSFSNENYEYRSYEQLLKKTYQTGRIRARLYSIMLFTIILFSVMLIMSVLYLGQDLTVGNLTSFVIYTITLTTGLASVSGLMNQVTSALGVCQGIFEIFDEPVSIVSGNSRPDSQNSDTIVQFKNATFSYPSKQSVNVIEELNLSIKKGQSVAIVGSSGSGKSSIINLIMRFYDVNQGALKIGGQNIKKLDLNELHRDIGFVSQQPTLFSGSLRQNVQYGVRQFEKSEQKIMKALQIANAKEFVLNKDMFPQGLDTLVGERGVTLSGGQKQRIAIARCVIKNPSILIFDEATSALDAQNQHKVQEAIDTLVNQKDKSRTMIIVAHRLSTIQNCDRIVVLNSGKIVQQGTHSDLFSRNGVYHNLFKKQISSHRQLLQQVK